jgi:hypothetical protein
MQRHNHLYEMENAKIRTLRDVKGNENDSDCSMNTDLMES